MISQSEDAGDGRYTKDVLSGALPATRRPAPARAATTARRQTITAKNHAPAKAAKTSPKAAAAPRPARVVAPKGKTAALRSPSESGRVAGKGRPTAKAAKPASGKATVIRVLSKEDPYRPGSVLASMRALLRDGMTTADLAVAFKAAGIKGTVSGFLHNARSKGVVA